MVDKQFFVVDREVVPPGVDFETWGLGSGVMDGVRREDRGNRTVLKPRVGVG